MIGRISGIVIDCPDPSALAGFYETLLGASRARDSAGWVTLNLGRGQPTVTLQRSDRYRAPDWSSGEPPQQAGPRQSRHMSPRVASGRKGVRACCRRPAAMFV